MTIVKNKIGYQATQKLSCGQILTRFGRTRIEVIEKLLNRIKELHEK